MNNSQVNWWEKFLDSFSSSGGHLVVGFVLLGFGCAMELIGLAYGHEVEVAGVTVIVLVIKGEPGSNQTRKERLASTTVSRTVTATDSPASTPEEKL